MKQNYYLILFSFLIVLAACKKENGEESAATVSTSSFKMKAPSCLITNGNTIDGDVYFTYDNQKRLIRLSAASDSDVTTYVYSGNTIIETETYFKQDGTTGVSTTNHFLNLQGLIDSSVSEWSGGMSTTTLYQYNSEGYLVRTYIRSSDGTIRAVSSCEYLSGNKIAEYRINTDWQGNVTDSSIDARYTYYSYQKGAMEAWEAWCFRKGRGSTNALKTVDYGSQQETYYYTMGLNNTPTQIEIKSSSDTYTIGINWDCN